MREKNETEGCTIRGADGRHLGIAFCGYPSPSSPGRMPCYQSLTAEQAHGDKSTDTHDCGCDGHNLAYFSTHISHFMDGDVDIHLMPLLVLFDYIYPPEPAFCGQLLDHENAPYIESLHDAWIVSASGLRAPPMS